MNKIVKIVSCVIVAGIIMSVTIAGKWHVGTSSATLNGEKNVAGGGVGIITGTPFRLAGSTEDLSIFYQAIQATSSPHYLINLYTSPNFNPVDGTGSFTTQAVATLTPSFDETSLDFTHRTASSSTATGIPGIVISAPWARIDIEGAALNAEATTFNLWIYEK